jgi:cytoskeletal protein RodZ
MKTVGQLLHAERSKKNITVEELSIATKIDRKYIDALENDRYDLLPSETFTKGFIRNLSKFLGCNPDEFIAVFRRDYKNPFVNQTTFKHPITRKYIIKTISSQLVPIIVGIIIFLVYLGFQFRAILTPPPLTLSKPQSGMVLASPVDIEGTTSTDSLVTINDDNVVKPDQNGFFQMRLSLPVGETVIKIKTTNRFSRSSIIEIPLTVISNWAGL